MPTPSEFAALVDEVKTVRHNLANHIQGTESSMRGVSVRLDRAEMSVQENTSITKRTEATALRTEENTKELVDTFKNVKGFVSVMQFVGKSGGVIALCGGLIVWAKSSVMAWLASK